MPFTFKVYHRHLNQQSLTELGIGSINIIDISKTESLSIIQKIGIVSKGIKFGELRVSLDLGCDEIHFGKEFIVLLYFILLNDIIEHHSLNIVI